MIQSVAAANALHVFDRAPSLNDPQAERELAVGSLNLACRWISDVSMVDGDDLPANENPHGYAYPSWNGAVREYNARFRQWSVFGPLWHTGQAVKALVMAHRVTGQPDYLTAANRAAAFVLRAQISDPADPDYGFIPAFENADSEISATSCMLEALDGLIELGNETGDERYHRAVIACLKWAHRTMYLPKEGLFLDDFHFATREARQAPNTLLYGVPGRPLNDDGVFLRGFQLGGGRELRDVFYGVAERLLRDEKPCGNWINFPPCKPDLGLLHPRHAFWWGRPMIMAFRDSGDRRFLDCAIRSADWYVNAQRTDGGMFRGTTTTFATPSFGQAASGIFAAACLWRDLIQTGHGDAYREPLQRALAFGRDMQLTHTKDPNLAGAIVEKCFPPDGTDELPYLIRDLGPIFYVQALAGALEDGILP